MLNETSVLSAAAPDVEQLNGLLLAVGEQDREAFLELYRTTITRMRARIRRVVLDPVSTEDIAQDVYFEIWTTAHRFDPTLSPAIAWMLRLAHARAVDRVRRTETARRHDTGPLDRSGDRSRDHFAESDARDEAAQRIHAGLPQLTARQREALRLVYLEGQSNTAAAQTLGITPAAFKSRLRDGVVALRQLLTPA